MKQTIDQHIEDFYNKLNSLETDKHGRLINKKSKSGYKFVYASGPVDKGCTVRMMLPEALKFFAGRKYGTVRNKNTGQMIPLGLSFDKFKSERQAADFLKLALENLTTFKQFIFDGDGTRYYKI